MKTLSEIDTTSKRAAKAAGFSWGIAEEVGKNMRLLELFGLPGIKNLNKYLKDYKKSQFEKITLINEMNECKKNCGPRLIEVVTYRWYGHVDWREDIDVGINRSSDDLKLWKERDPIGRLIQAMKTKYKDIQPFLDKISSDIKNTTQMNWQLALNDPYPDKSDLIDFVYSSKKEY